MDFMYLKMIYFKKLNICKNYYYKDVILFRFFYVININFFNKQIIIKLKNK
jgi:hypothetical protein